MTTARVEYAGDTGNHRRRADSLCYRRRTLQENHQRENGEKMKQAKCYVQTFVDILLEILLILDNFYGDRSH